MSESAPEYQILPIAADDSSQPAYDLTFRVEQLEKIFRYHLGPNFAASSLNIPHPQFATVNDLIAALTVRVTALEASVATLTTIAYAAGRYL